jgi:hypothetical protein
MRDLKTRAFGGPRRGMRAHTGARARLRAASPKRACTGAPIQPRGAARARSHPGPCHAPLRPARRPPRSYPIGRSRLEALAVVACACIMSVASLEVVQYAAADIHDGLAKGASRGPGRRE